MGKDFEQPKNVGVPIKKIEKAKDIFEGNPKVDSRKLERVTELLKETYDLPKDVIDNILATIGKVYDLEKYKDAVPANVASYVGDSGKIPEKIPA